MTLEQRALKRYGATDIPDFAVWLLPDGTLLNGSHEGHQRDIDHRDICDFFRCANPADGMDKFMRRGNIRWSMSDCGLNIELHVPPTRRQAACIRRAMHLCFREGLPVNADVVSKRNRLHPMKAHTLETYMEAYQRD